MGVLFIVMAGIIIIRNMFLWSPGFFYDFLVSPEITNEKFSVGMIIFGCIMIGLGFRKSNVKTK
tara:strand:- start:6565 stop:6756 length:192 start_codon:yes stop_codon:yes gene_type:complete